MLATVPKSIFRVGIALALLTAVMALPSRAEAQVAGGIVFRGGGFGHGLGMSQYGAYGRAAAGQDVATILAAYYQGTNLAIQDQPAIRVHVGESVPGRDFAITPGAGRTDPVTATGDFTIINTAIKVASATTTPGSPMVVGNSGDRWWIRYGTAPGEVVTASTASPLVISFASQNAPIVLGLNNFRYLYGEFELINVPGKITRVVNRSLTMQQYLYGLGEMPSSWPDEALRAQAIAARTYAIDKSIRSGDNRPGCNCTLFSNTNDQVFNGAEKILGVSGNRWQSAVDTTDRTVIHYAGQPIQAFYASSNGGSSDNVEEIYSATLPYLRAAADPFDSYGNANANWTRSYTIAELSRWSSAASDTAVGTVTSIELLGPFTGGGRVGRVIDAARGGARINGTAGSKRVSGDRLRSMINSGVTSDGGGSSRQLLSTKFRTGSIQLDVATARGGLTVAAGDVNGDTIPEIVTGAGPGSGPLVRITTSGGTLLNQFYAFDPAFRGGINVAVGNVDGDPLQEVIVAPMAGGGPNVRVYTASGVLKNSFLAYDPGWFGGVFVAAGNVVGDGRAEIVTGVGAGGGPDVRAFTAEGTLAVQPFFAYGSGFRGGVQVAAGDVLGDGYAEIITGAGKSGGPHVQIFDGSRNNVGGFFAYRPQDTGGVFVAAGDVAGDAKAEIITSTGDGLWPVVRTWNPSGTQVAPEFLAFDLSTWNGAYIAYMPAPQRSYVVGARPGRGPVVDVFGI